MIVISNSEINRDAVFIMASQHNVTPRHTHHVAKEGIFTVKSGDVANSTISPILALQLHAYI